MPTGVVNEKLFFLCHQNVLQVEPINDTFDIPDCMLPKIMNKPESIWCKGNGQDHFKMHLCSAVQKSKYLYPAQEDNIFCRGGVTAQSNL